MAHSDHIEEMGAVPGSTSAADLERELARTVEASRELSRRIGEAKKRGEDPADLIADKRELSGREKRLREQLTAMRPRETSGPSPPGEGGAVAPGAASASDADAGHSQRTHTAPAMVGALRITKLDEPGEAQWDAFVDHHPNASVYHLSGWRHVISQSFGQTPHCLQAQDEAGTVHGVLPLIQMKSRLFGNFLVSVPFFTYGGVLAHSRDVERRLIEAAIERAKHLGCSHLEMRETVSREGYPQRLDKVSMRLRLPADETALWRQIGSKVRAQVRKARRHDLDVRVGGRELLADFYTVFAHNMRDLGTPVYSRTFFERVLEQPRTGHKQVVVGYLEGRPVSAAFLLGHGETMEVPWASTLRDSNRFNTNMGLYWALLVRACEQKYTIFDFGRSSREAPTYRFKKQWGAEPVQLYWHYWMGEGEEPPQLNPQNPKYALAIRAWQTLPVWLTRVVGPPIARNLP